MHKDDKAGRHLRVIGGSDFDPESGRRGRRSVTNFADLAHWSQVERALHGDLRPVIELLESDEPLSRVLRDYIAEELASPAEKRFVRRKRADLSVRARDQSILWKVFWAKAELASLRLPANSTDEEELAAIGNLHSISDDAALDHLSKQGVEIDADTLKNARRRAHGGIANPKPKKTRVSKPVPPTVR